MKNFIFSSLLIIIIINYCKSQEYQDPCFPKGFITHHDSTLVQHYKLYKSGVGEIDTQTIEINYIDFSPKGEQIVMGSYRIGTDIGRYNTILIKKNNKWEVLLNDSNKYVYDSISKSYFKNSYTTRRMTDYKIVGNYIYLLCGGIGSLILFDSTGHYTDLSLNKAYLLKINMYDLTDKKQIFLSNDYYAKNMYIFENECIVYGDSYCYWYDKDLTNNYKSERWRKNDISSFYFIQGFSVSKDSMYILLAKDKYNLDSNKIDYRLYYSSDGMKSINKVNTPIQKTGGLNFIDSQTGYYSGIYADSNYVIYSKIFKTIDGGNSWSVFYDNKSNKTSNINHYLQYPADLIISKNQKQMIFNSIYSELHISNNYGKDWKPIIQTIDSSCELFIMYMNPIGKLSYYNNTIYIPQKFDYDYTYYTYTNSELLDVENYNDISIYSSSTQKYLVTGNKFVINDIINISEDTKYYITNLTGETLKEHNLEGKNIDISNLNLGTYILRIDNKIYIFVKTE